MSQSRTPWGRELLRVNRVRPASMPEPIASVRLSCTRLYIGSGSTFLSASASVDVVVALRHFFVDPTSNLCFRSNGRCWNGGFPVSRSGGDHELAVTWLSYDTSNNFVTTFDSPSCGILYQVLKVVF